MSDALAAELAAIIAAGPDLAAELARIDAATRPQLDASLADAAEIDAEWVQVLARLSTG